MRIVGLHKVISFLRMCGYLTIKSNFTAFFLDFGQKVQVVWILGKTALEAAQIFGHHWSIVKLREGVFVWEIRLPPLCPIMSKVSFRQRFEERVHLPCATWEALIFFLLTPHFPWLALKEFAAIWRVLKGLLGLGEGPVRGLIENFIGTVGKSGNLGIQFLNLFDGNYMYLIIVSQIWAKSTGAALQMWRIESTSMFTANLVCIENPERWSQS